tara:strand:- start:3716 stop:3964 length:249 start_codon:yes stop_codon:yes gene_type:complete
MCALAFGLVGLGMAIGVVIENARQSNLEAIRKQKEEKIATSVDYLNFFTEVVQEQNKKLDTLAACRAYVDPEVTQDIPVMKD